MDLVQKAQVLAPPPFARYRIESWVSGQSSHRSRASARLQRAATAQVRRLDLATLGLALPPVIINMKRKRQISGLQSTFPGSLARGEASELLKEVVIMKFANLEISKIDTNKDNPRGIDIPTEDSRLSYLKDSIAKFGVMVPVVVTPHGDRYLLVDGERRYFAAKSVGLDKLPAYIITNDKGDELSSRDLLFRMFQIHHLREQWGPIQQCHALEATYDRVIRRKDIKSLVDVKVQVKAVTDELAAITGIDQRTTFDRVKFLRWPDDVKTPLYHTPSDGSYWYICEIEDKIVIPALCNYPEYFEKVSVNDVRKDLYKKLNVSLERATEVRKVAPFLREALSKTSDKRVVGRILDRLKGDPEMTYADAQEEFHRAFPDILKREPPSPRRLLTDMTNLDDQLGEFDVSSVGKAQHRAKAKPSELLAAARSLSVTLQGVMEQLAGARS